MRAGGDAEAALQQLQGADRDGWGPAAGGAADGWGAPGDAGGVAAAAARPASAHLGPPSSSGFGAHAAAPRTVTGVSRAGEDPPSSREPLKQFGLGSRYRACGSAQTTCTSVRKWWQMAVCMPRAGSACRAA